MNELMILVVAVSGSVWIGGKLVVRWRHSRSTAAGGVYGTIEGYVGAPRQGKTTLFVLDLIARAQLVASYDRPVLILANVKVRPPAGIEYEFLRRGPDGFDLLQVLKACRRMRQQGGAIILGLDELGIICPARMWHAFGPDLMFLFQQSGKLYIEVRWTTQALSFADVQLREMTAVTHSVSANPPQTVASRLAGKRPRSIEWSTWDRTAVGTDAAYLETRKVKYRQEWEQLFDTDAFIVPPKKLKGDEEIAAFLDDWELELEVERLASEWEAAQEPVAA